MKLLVVNNHSKHLEKLLLELKEIAKIKLLDFKNLNNAKYDKYDAIILSGSSSLSVLNHAKEYERELAIIRQSKKPILGICLGFELINFAFGEELKRLKTKEVGFLKIKLTSSDKIFESIPKEFKVYEAHRWVVKKNSNLYPLAKSKDGIEAVKHPSKKIYGLQFHPEIFKEKDYAKTIFKNFLRV